MSGFIQGEDRSQATLFPECLDDYVAEDSAVRVIDAFIDELDLSGLGFKTQPNDTGRPAYHPTTMLKLFANAFVAIDGSKFKAVNNRDRNFTRAKMKRRIADVDATIERYLRQLAEADHLEPAEDKTHSLEDKIAALKKEMARLKKVEARMLVAPGRWHGGLQRADCGGGTERGGRYHYLCSQLVNLAQPGPGEVRPTPVPLHRRRR